MATAHLVVSNHVQHVQQILAYPELAIGFIKTHSYCQIHLDIKHNESIV